MNKPYHRRRVGEQVKSLGEAFTRDATDAVKKPFQKS